MTGRRPATRTQLDWLTGELVHWQAEGWLEAQHADEILRSYRTARRVSLSRVVLTLGAGFVGVGVIWLVAANLDALPPMLRFGLVAALWIAATTIAELLAGRREHGDAIPSPVVGATRGLAALTFGGVVFQAAQSLQVPAYEPVLLGVWGLGALLQAYVVRALAPLLIGLVLVSAWYVWQVAWSASDAGSFVLALLAAGVVAVAVAAVHPRWRKEFAEPWREVGAALLLLGLFLAALPDVADSSFAWTWPLLVGVAVAAVAAAVGFVVGRGRARLEPPAAVVVGLLATALVLTAGDPDPGSLLATDVVHAIVAVAVYVGVAAGVAVLGVVHDSWRLTALAVVALVTFTTAQSFAVFARIVDGAWLFLLLGAVLLATGYAADRGRRELAQALDSSGATA